MNKLFYFTIIAVVLCSCNTSTDKGKLAEVSNNVELGQAGTFKFLAFDSLEVTADYYPNEAAESLIILCHQGGFSRGAYKDIAPRLVDSGFACLALDLRSGNMAQEILNETANRARENGKASTYIDAKQDIEAAINYVASNSTKNIYLWGSSYSASLALIIANEDDRIQKVVAFSPGEFLSNQEQVRSSIGNLSKPIFITGSKGEYDIIVKPIVDALNKNNLITLKQDGSGNHGTKTLWSDNTNTANIYEKLFEFL
ncbi:MAG: hypothetical protein COA58_02155 [Bacteroidetes bacterium]|nr:MAG: hypothetical protein COA58_02155 [Bacteroidota bacterium]